MKLTPTKKPHVKRHDELGPVLVVGSCAHPKRGLIFGVRPYQPTLGRFIGSRTEVEGKTLTSPLPDDAECHTARLCLAAMNKAGADAIKARKLATG